MKVIDITIWIDLFLQALNQTFANRVWFVGLQGSYAREEAGDTSDIDMVVILDEISEQHSDYVHHKHNNTRDNDSRIELIRNVIVKHFVGDNGINHTYKGYQKSRQHIECQHSFVRLIVAYKSFEHSFSFFFKI